MFLVIDRSWSCSQYLTLFIIIFVCLRITKEIIYFLFTEVLTFIDVILVYFAQFWSTRQKSSLK